VSLEALVARRLLDQDQDTDMSDVEDNARGETVSFELSKTGTYESPRKALEEVGGYYKGWSTKLTEASLQMCYALIGANWVVFGSVGKLLESPWAKWSLLMVMVTLASNVAGAWWLSESLRRRFKYAEKNKVQWALEFNENADKESAWPSTEGIDNTAIFLRHLKALLPIAGGVFLIIGAIRK
jgi:hypothetical protein